MTKDWNVAKYVVEIEVTEDRDHLEDVYKEEETNLSFEDWVKQHGWKDTYRLMSEDGIFGRNSKTKPIFKSFVKEKGGK